MKLKKSLLHLNYTLIVLLWYRDNLHKLATAGFFVDYTFTRLQENKAYLVYAAKFDFYCLQAE